MSPFPLSLLLLPAPLFAAIEEQNVREKPSAPPPAPVLTKPPELLQFVEAVYPEDLLAQGLSGEVLLTIDIDARGLVERVEVLSSSHPQFGESAVAAATRFVFSPAEIDYAPGRIRIEYRYAFAPKMEPETPAPMAEDVPPPLGPVRLRGTVFEAGVRKTIAAAVIAVDGKALAETDAEGRFEVRDIISSNDGAHVIEVRSPYHQAYRVEETLPPEKALEVNYYLLRQGGDPFQTVVHGRALRREVAKVELKREELQKVPGTFGDPVRVIENLPGMSRTPGGLGGTLLVRGSKPQDSKVFFDGVEVPLFFHFGGLTSIISSEFLEQIDFYPGGFGARFGRATAGIVDVQSRDLDCDKLRAVSKVDFIDASAFVCQPVGPVILAAAARRSYVDQLIPLVLDHLPGERTASLTAAPVYWDYQVKAQTTLGAHRFDLLAFGSDDKLAIIRGGTAEDFEVSLGLHLTFHRLVLRHRYRHGDLEIRSSVAPGRIVNEFGQVSESIGLDNQSRGELLLVDWREELRLTLFEGLELSFGLDNLFGEADLHFELPVPSQLKRFPSPVFDFTDAESYDTVAPAAFQGYFVEATYESAFGLDLDLIGGLRAEHLKLHKTKHQGLLPRLTARWEVLAGSILKASFGMYEKLPEPNFLLESFGNPKLTAELSTHYIVGAEQAFGSLVHLDVQAFYNAKSDLPSTSTKTRIEGGQELREVFNNDGSGKSYGLEILFRHLATPGGRFYGWVAYTLSRSWITDRSSGRFAAEAQFHNQHDQPLSEYISPYDQTHILTVVGQWVLPYGFELGGRFRLVSGNPFTPRDTGPVYLDTDADGYRVVTDDIERNSERMPTFHQLDVRVERTFTYDLWKLTAFLEVLNAYNASNVEGYSYNYDFSKRLPVTFLPIVPVLGVKGEF